MWRVGVQEVQARERRNNRMVSKEEEESYHKQKN